MKRLMINGVIGLSLVLCAPVMVLWAHSYWYQCSLIRTGSHPLQIGSYGGNVHLSYHRGSANIWPGIMTVLPLSQWDVEHKFLKPEYRYEYETPTVMDYDWYAYGFGAQWGGPYGGSYAIRFPHWFLAMLLMVLPVLVVRKRLKVRAGHCRNCDYDLTGNQTGQCPECGAKTTPSPANPTKQPTRQPAVE